MNCYCGLARPYSECCEPCHSGSHPAATAEQLMRSRFSAYVLKLVPYIANTYFPPQQSAQALAEIADFAGTAQFISLQVISSGNKAAIEERSFNPLPRDTGAVETSYVHFKVRFIIADKLHLLEEHSRFIQLQQEWRYVDGVLLPHPICKVGRNDHCPCGSGKKYKACTMHWLNSQPMVD